MAGGFGIYDIIVRFSPGALHFIQAFRDGPLYTTTIFDKESRDGQLKAVTPVTSTPTLRCPVSPRSRSRTTVNALWGP